MADRELPSFILSDGRRPMCPRKTRTGPLSSVMESPRGDGTQTRLTTPDLDVSDFAPIHATFKRVRSTVRRPNVLSEWLRSSSQSEEK